MEKTITEFDELTDLTDHQKKAILIIGQRGSVRPRQFARLFWPDSEGWQRHAKAGPHGVSQGGGMSLAAGGYLGKLRRKGLLKPNVQLMLRPTEHGSIYTLSDKGREFYNRLIAETEEAGAEDDDTTNG